jgi:hypothetical protein
MISKGSFSMKKTINYQQIYEEEITPSLRESLEKADRFYDLSNQDRLLVEELVDAGYRRALEDALDPEVLAETAALSAEMGTQLYNFANMIGTYLSEQSGDVEE